MLPQKLPQSPRFPSDWPGLGLAGLMATLCCFSTTLPRTWAAPPVAVVRPPVAAARPPIEAETLLKGGTIHDGHGGKPFVGDVALRGLFEALVDISRDVCLVFALHPRTRATATAADLMGLLSQGRILTTQPLSYLRALGLMRDARLAITDSGGVQEETTALGVPCLTVRDNTERPITVTQGTNTLVGRSPAALRQAVAGILASGGKSGRVPEFWDGRAAERIADHLDAFLRARLDGQAPTSAPTSAQAQARA